MKFEMIKKNDLVELTIEDISSEGSGIGKLDGFPLFIPLAAVGDRLSVRIVKLNKSYGFGIIDKIIKPSPYRRENSCKSFSKCGGCVYRHISYEEELRIKTKKVKNALSKIANIDAEVPLCIGSYEDGYRNKAMIPVGAGESGIFHGFYALNSHRIVPFSSCDIQNPAFNEIANIITGWMNEFSVTAYDDKTKKGRIRHIYLRIGEMTGEILVCLVINGDNLKYSDKLISKLKNHSENIKGILININKEATNVILGNKTETLWGRPYIYDKLGELTFKISPLSFYQVNRRQAESLYKKVSEYAGLTGRETVFDMYCGTGTITLFLASQAKTVFGVEIVKEAVENANENAILNNIKNAKFFIGDSSKGAKWLEGLGVTPDIIVVDPPRKGCEKKVLEDIEKLNPKKLIYVSCDPATLARDVKILKERGFWLVKIQPFDMFPKTSHVECCCLLSRTDK